MSILEICTGPNFDTHIQTTLSEQILDVAIAVHEAVWSQTACRMTASENWWRANEIAMSHLTRRTAMRYHSHDKASLDLGSNSIELRFWEIRRPRLGWVCLTDAKQARRPRRGLFCDFRSPLRS
jgi:hypothetical protein